MKRIKPTPIGKVRKETKRGIVKRTCKHMIISNSQFKEPLQERLHGNKFSNIIFIFFSYLLP